MNMTVTSITGCYYDNFACAATLEKLQSYLISSDKNQKSSQASFETLLNNRFRVQKKKT